MIEPGRVELLVCVGLAFLLRTAFAMIVSPYPWNDSSTHRRSGEELFAAGEITSHLVMPLYPALLHIAGWTGIILLQIVLASLTVGIVYQIARSAFESLWVSRLAALLMAVDPLSMFYADQRLTETVYTFLLSASVLGFYQRRYAVGSILLVASLLVRPTMDLLGPVLVSVFGIMHSRGRAIPVSIARPLCLYVLIYALMMTPWWLHNAHKYHQFVRLSLGDGIVMRLENNDTFYRLKYFDWEALARIIKAGDHTADPVAANKALAGQAVSWIRENEAAYWDLSARRLVRFWFPAMARDEPAFVPRYYDLLVTLFWLPVLVAALIGAAKSITMRRWSAAPLFLILGYLTAVHVATHALVRYRVPAAPFVFVIAAAVVVPRTRRGEGRVAVA